MKVKYIKSFIFIFFVRNAKRKENNGDRLIKFLLKTFNNFNQLFGLKKCQFRKNIDIGISGLKSRLILNFFLVCPIWLPVLFFYNEPELGVEIDPGMALTPLPSSIGRGSNPRPSDFVLYR